MVILEPIKDNEKGLEARTSTESFSGEVTFGKEGNDNERTTD